MLIKRESLLTNCSTGNQEGQTFTTRSGREYEVHQPETIHDFDPDIIGKLADVHLDVVTEATADQIKGHDGLRVTLPSVRTVSPSKWNGMDQEDIEEALQTHLVETSLKRS